MLRKPQRVVFLSLLIFATSCGPMVPLSYVDGTPASQLVQSIETNDATVWLQYMRTQHRHMVLDLEIANHSESSMSIAPQQITFYASSKPFVPIYTVDNVHELSAPNSTLTMTRQFASDPYSIQKLYIEKAKAKKVQAGLFTILALGVIAYDIAKDSQIAGKETFTSRNEWKAFGRDVLVTTALTAADIAKTSAEQTASESQYLPYELFPECTIRSGGNVRGKVFLPVESSYKYLRIVIPLGDDDYIFDLRRR